MKRKSNLFFIVILAMILMNLAFAIPAYACSPAPEAMEYTFQDRIENAPIILVGTVVDGIASWGTTLEEVTVEVDTYLKGTGYETVQIHGFGDGADCRSSVQLGETYVFFASGEQGETLQAVYLGVHDAAFNANPARIGEVTSHTGQSNEPIPLPLQVKIQNWIHRNWVQMSLVLAFIVLAFAGGMLLYRFRMSTNRKSKAKRG